jgi:hypothetical protein
MNCTCQKPRLPKAAIFRLQEVLLPPSKSPPRHSKYFNFSLGNAPICSLMPPPARILPISFLIRYQIQSLPFPSIHPSILLFILHHLPVQSMTRQICHQHHHPHTLTVTSSPLSTTSISSPTLNCILCSPSPALAETNIKPNAAFLSSPRSIHRNDLSVRSGSVG